MVKGKYVSNDGTITCDKKRRPGEAPELICRRCCQCVPMSTADTKNYKWQDVVNAHAKKQCTPPQDSWQYRANARAIEAPELRGLVFVARRCVDTEMLGVLTQNDLISVLIKILVRSTPRTCPGMCKAFTGFFLVSSNQK